VPLATDNGKLAVMEWDQDYEPGLPLSPGALGQDDQQQLLWGIPEVLWGAGAGGPPGPVLRRRFASRGARRRFLTRLIRRLYASRQPRVSRRIGRMDFPTVTVVKSPNEAINWVLDFRVFEEVSLDGGALSNPQKSSPAGITVAAPTVSAAAINGVPAGQAVLVKISGGTAGSDYSVEVWATVTAAGVTSDRAYRLNVQVR
jgi:hypothetical protein